MTLHINNIPDYHCHACDKVYIPYAKDFHCPYCGVTSKESFDLIPQIVDSLMFHKMEYGRFTPDARYTVSLAEYLQSHVFHVMDSLDDYRKEDPNIEDDKHLQNILELFTSKGDSKEIQYITGIILASYKLYQELGPVEKMSDEDLETPAFIRNRLKK